MKVIEGEIDLRQNDFCWIGDDDLLETLGHYVRKDQKVRVTIEPIPNYGDKGCPSCKYLGFYKEHDLYYCPQGGFPTLIAHDEDGDYKSGMFMNGTDDHITEAYKRAKAKGFIE